MRAVGLQRWRAAATVATVGADLWAAPSRTQTAYESLIAFLATRLGMEARHVAAVMQRQAVAVLLQGSLEREIVVASVRIDAPAERTVALVRDIERLESGRGFRTKRLRNPPQLEDFAAFSVTPEEGSDFAITAMTHGYAREDCPSWMRTA